MTKLFANSGDSDQTPHSVASNLGLHCLPITGFRVSQLQWVNLYLSMGKFFYWQIDDAFLIFFQKIGFYIFLLFVYKRRQFAWNVKLFSVKIRKIFQNFYPAWIMNDAENTENLE